MSTLLLPSEILSMSAQAARLLVESGDGDGALLYLALLECGGDGEKAAASLRWQADRLRPVWDRLAALGLVRPASPKTAPPPPPPQDDRPPEYSRGELTAALEREPDFQALCQEMENRLGRVFSDNDLKSLYTIYDYLGFSPEVILTLTSWVIQRERKQKNNPAACPRMPQIRREAFRWKRLGVDTLERAEEYLRRQQAVDGREWGILSSVGVAERRPAVEQEREFIAKWVEREYSDELIRLAYERTIYRRGSMSWPYVDKILQSWQQSGWRTPEQVRAGEKTAPRSAKPAKGGSKPDYQPSQDRIQENADWLDRFLEEQQKGGA